MYIHMYYVYVQCQVGTEVLEERQSSSELFLHVNCVYFRRQNPGYFKENSNTVNGTVLCFRRVREIAQSDY
jgi:hypothetical protein